MCFEFLYNLVRNISYSKKNSARYYHKCTQVFMYSTREVQYREVGDEPLWKRFIG